MEGAYNRLLGRLQCWILRPLLRPLELETQKFGSSDQLPQACCGILTLKTETIAPKGSSRPEMLLNLWVSPEFWISSKWENSAKSFRPPDVIGQSAREQPACWEVQIQVSHSFFFLNLYLFLALILPVMMAPLGSLSWPSWTCVTCSCSSSQCLSPFGHILPTLEPDE